jgi:hypothetical protein
LSNLAEHPKSIEYVNLLKYFKNISHHSISSNSVLCVPAPVFIRLTSGYDGDIPGVIVEMPDILNFSEGKDQK